MPNLCADIVTDINSTSSNLSKEIIAYPNPTEGIINVGVSFNKESDLTISVFNNVGQMVYSNNLYNVSTTMQAIDLSNLSSGMYLIKIKSDYGIDTKNVILSK